jgi:hypothetical protein
VHEQSRKSRSPGSSWSRVIALVALAIPAWVSGCGDPDRSFESTAHYEPPSEHAVVVETVVDLPFDEAWNELIRRVSAASYEIATLEKASHFLAIDLRRSSDLASPTDRPGRYVDCGRTLRTFTDGEDVERFEYAVADSSRHREVDVVKDGFRVSEVLRQVDLEARVNIYLQPEGEKRTRITLNTRYDIDIEVSGNAEVFPMDSALPGGPTISFGPRRESIRFTTFQPGHDSRSGGLVCRATGELEHALIALANPAAAI